MGAGTLTASFFIVSVEPFLVAFIHVVDETTDKGRRGALLEGVWRLDITRRVMPSFWWVALLIVLNNTCTVGCGDVCCRLR